jgi:hypothetical protein
MQNQNQSKLFAFQLAEKRKQQAKPAEQWKIREGVSSALGCTYVDVDAGLLRASDRYVGTDAGTYC